MLRQQIKPKTDQHLNSPLEEKKKKQLTSENNPSDRIWISQSLLRDPTGGLNYHPQHFGRELKKKNPPNSLRETRHIPLGEEKESLRTS